MNYEPIPPPEKRPSLPKRLWLLLREPRVVTASHAVAYSLIISMGIATLISPPTTLSLAWGASVTLVWAIVLTVGGCFGLAGCLAGHWWLEAIGIGGVCLGIGLYIFIVIALHMTASGSRLTQAFGLASLLCLMISRYFRIRDFALDPTRKRFVDDLEPA